MTLAFDVDGGIDPDRLRNLFVRECARNGLITNGTLLATNAHDDEAVERSLDTLVTALKAVKEHIASGRKAIQQAVEATGCFGSIDMISEEETALRIVGWLLLPDGPADSIDIVASDGQSQPLTPSKRLDLGAAFPNIPRAEQGGYSTYLPAATFARNGTYEFTIRGQRDGECIFSCHIVRRSDHAGASDPRALYDSEKRTLYL
jgi:hypothetical protein